MNRPTLRLSKPSKRPAVGLSTKTAKKRDETKAQQGLDGRRRPTGTECLAQLAQHYPRLFDPANPKPLAIGTHAAMRTDCGLSGAKIRRGLREWTRHVSYLSALAEGGHRFDINGNVAGEISDAAIEGAREKLAMFDDAKDSE